MINRIRDIRKGKGFTLADVAERCDPPTTAQTIGRLETGTRNLSLTWMNRIAAALEVEPELLLKSESEAAQPQIVARLAEAGAEAMPSPRDAIPPTAFGGDGERLVMAVDTSHGDYRAGDQVWLRHAGPEDFPRLLNRDVLAPRPGGRFAFGRMIDRDDDRVALLPPGPGQKQVIVEHPPWLGVAEMLVRPL